MGLPGMLLGILVMAPILGWQADRFRRFAWWLLGGISLLGVVGGGGLVHAVYPALAPDALPPLWAMFVLAIPGLDVLNIMRLHTPSSAILSALVFNAVIIPALIPIAIKGVKYRPLGANAILRNNLLVYGAGGILMPFAGIKLIDMLLSATGLF
jgi:hypothetical protein